MGKCWTPFLLLSALLGSGVAAGRLDIAVHVLLNASGQICLLLTKSACDHERPEAQMLPDKNLPLILQAGLGR